MASKRVTMLKWRKYKGQWRAGPFAIEVFYQSARPANVYIDDAHQDDSFWDSFETLDKAKRACEKLASCISGAMK